MTDILISHIGFGRTGEGRTLNLVAPLDGEHTELELHVGEYEFPGVTEESPGGPTAVFSIPLPDEEVTAPLVLLADSEVIGSGALSVRPRDEGEDEAVTITMRTGTALTQVLSPGGPLPEGTALTLSELDLVEFLHDEMEPDE